MPEQEKTKSNTSYTLQKIKDSILNFIIPLVAILVTALLAIFYIYPSYKDLPVKKQDLETKTKTKDSLSKKVNDLNR